VTDESRRQLEREAAQGDQQARIRLLVERVRAGEFGDISQLGHCCSCRWWCAANRDPQTWGDCRAAETRVQFTELEVGPPHARETVEHMRCPAIIAHGTRAHAEPHSLHCSPEDGDETILRTQGDFGCIQWHRARPGAFSDWLLLQTHRQDPVGHLARRVAGLQDQWPRDADTLLDDVCRALRDVGLRQSVFIQALLAAWEQWLVTSFSQLHGRLLPSATP